MTIARLQPRTLHGNLGQHASRALRCIARLTLIAATLLILLLPSSSHAEAAHTAAEIAANRTWVLAAAAMVFLMQCGFLCLEVGSVQPRAATITALKNVVDWVVAAATFFFVGWGLMFGHSFAGLIGTDFLLLEGVPSGGLEELGIHLHFVFQLAFAGTAATIVSGALAERTSFGAYVVVSIVVTSLIYPLFGHWVWGDSFFPLNRAWLAGVGFYDFAGSSVVHAVGGWVSLVGILIVGPRLGRFGSDGAPRELPSMGLHWNAFATLMLWFCWWGFNGGSTLAIDDRVGPIIVNTNLGGAFGGIGALVHCTWLERRQGLSSKFLNGILAGLVAVTAGCSVIAPLSAVAIGLIAGVLANVVSALLLRFRIDDPVGAVPVHLGGGLWGTLAVGLFASDHALAHVLQRSRIEQLGAQLLGMGACAVWVIATSVVTFLAVRRYVGLRVSPLEETEGFDLSGVLRKPDEAPLSEAELLHLLAGEA